MNHSTDHQSSRYPKIPKGIRNMLIYSFYLMHGLISIIFILTSMPTILNLAVSGQDIQFYLDSGKYAQFFFGLINLFVWLMHFPRLPRILLLIPNEQLFIGNLFFLLTILLFAFDQTLLSDLFILWFIIFVILLLGSREQMKALYPGLFEDN